jgi:NADPH-dependent 2,4-dienoyl-CoA reductase/sulfur reductase-like enzyme
MRQVCVVGWGTAGVEAAREALRCGTEVTVIEKSENPDPPWRSWPDLMSSDHPPRPLHGRARPGSLPVTLLRTEARSAGPGFVSTREGVRLRFDAIVAATGCSFEPSTLPGQRKLGVHVLDRTGEYAELGRTLESAAKVVVCGEGSRGMQVADHSCRGRTVLLVISRWQHGEPPWAIRAAIYRAAQERGVLISYGTVSKAVGSGSLEAAVIDGKVTSCDALAVVPLRVPRVIPMQALTGRHGGLAVDRYLMTSAARTFAAGGCAELSCEFAHTATLEDETGMSGRVAGANASGEHLAFWSAGSRVIHTFGLRWTRAGAEVGSLSGFPAVGVVSETTDSSACTIAFERTTGRVLGVEAVESPDSPLSDLSSIASGSASLKALAYRSSSDISLISDTARLGLKSWQNS